MADSKYDHLFNVDERHAQRTDSTLMPDMTPREAGEILREAGSGYVRRLRDEIEGLKERYLDEMDGTVTDALKTGAVQALRYVIRKIDADLKAAQENLNV